MNRKLLARNTVVQLFILYTNPEHHNTSLGTDGQTDNIMMPVVTVQFAKN